MKEIQVGKALAFVSDSDYLLVARYNWFLTGNGYAFRWLPRNGAKKKQMQMMHRLITSASPDEEVDHINRMKLDNRRENLRLVTHSQNQQNVVRAVNPVSGFKGVRPNHGKWLARITFNKKEIHLGSFDTAALASNAYNEAAVRLYGPHAYVNGSPA